MGPEDLSSIEAMIGYWRELPPGFKLLLFAEGATIAGGIIYLVRSKFGKPRVSRPRQSRSRRPRSNQTSPSPEWRPELDPKRPNPAEEFIRRYLTGCPIRGSERSAIALEAERRFHSLNDLQRQINYINITIEELTTPKEGGYTDSTVDIKTLLEYKERVKDYQLLLDEEADKTYWKNSGMTPDDLPQVSEMINVIVTAFNK